MLARRYRLTKQDHVPGILKGGKLKRNPHFVLRFRTNEKGHPRFSVIVSQKVLPKAVDRNRLRRRVYEIIRLELKSNPSLGKIGIDCLLLPHKNLPLLPPKALHLSLQSLLHNVS